MFNFNTNFDLDMLMTLRKGLFNGLVRWKSGLGLIKWFLSTYRLIWAKAPTKMRVKLFRRFARSLYLIAKHNSSKKKRNGVIIPNEFSHTYLVKYLKTSAVMLQQYCAKNTERYSSRNIGGVAVSATRAGIPRIIPKEDRIQIRKGNKEFISLWLSLLNIYRVLDCNYNYKSMYNTITDPGVRWSLTAEVQDYIANFWKLLDKKVTGTSPVLPPFEPFLTNKSSPHSRPSTSVLGMIAFVHSLRKTIYMYRAGAMMAIARAADEFNALNLSEMKSKEIKAKKILSSPDFIRSNLKWLISFRHLIRRVNPNLLHLIDGIDEKVGDLSFNDLSVSPYKRYRDRISMLLTTSVDPWRLPNFTLKWLYNNISTLEIYGKLKALEEAAGKLRIIAIVDPLTQFIMKPIDDWVSNIVRQLPQDGKYHQEGPLILLWNKVKSRRSKFVGSVDMSAATDRLPVLLQEAILAHKFGAAFAKNWSTVLVGRYYYVYSQAGGISRMLKYAVGQPMGARSSWTMLDLCHHFLWQWAAWRSGQIRKDTWFENYSVLGDDSNALNKVIVQTYMQICAEIGVGINKSKSLFSRNGSFEFAKRFWNYRGDCSPVSLKELLVSSCNVAVLGNWPRKRPIRWADLLYIVGYRHSVVSKLHGNFSKLPKKARNLIIMCKSPWGSYPSNSFIDWITLDGFQKRRLLDYDKIVLLLSKLLDTQDAKLKRRLITNGLPGLSSSSYPIKLLDKDRLAEMYRYFVPERDYDQAVKMYGKSMPYKTCSKFYEKQATLLSDGTWAHIDVLLSRAQYVAKERVKFFQIICKEGLDTAITMSTQIYEPLRIRNIYRLAEISEMISVLRGLLMSFLDKGENSPLPKEYEGDMVGTEKVSYVKSGSCIHPDSGICWQCIRVSGPVWTENTSVRHPVSFADMPDSVKEHFINAYFKEYIHICDELDLTVPHIYSTEEPRKSSSPNLIRWVKLWSRFHSLTR